MNTKEKIVDGINSGTLKRWHIHEHERVKVGMIMGPIPGFMKKAYHHPISEEDFTDFLFSDVKDGNDVMDLLFTGGYIMEANIIKGDEGVIVTLDLMKYVR